jgi:hypothetical protein
MSNCIRASRRAGFSLVELSIASGILLLLAGGLAQTVGIMRRVTTNGSTEARIHTQAETAMTQMINDLRLSGFVTSGGKTYPYVFENGAPNVLIAGMNAGMGNFALHAHALAQKTSEPDEASFWANREIVFIHPRLQPMRQTAAGLNLTMDEDPTGHVIVKTYEVPMQDVNGGAMWGADEISFVLITRPDGENYLERRVNGGQARTLARNVERVTFDTSATAEAGANLNGQAVRVRLWMRETDERQQVYRHFLEAVVTLRNQ